MTDITPETPTTPESPAEALHITLDFPGDKRYGASLTADKLDTLGAAEFARQAAEMVERTIVGHLNALPMLPVEEVAP